MTEVTTYCIFTEEYPNIDEITLMLRVGCNIHVTHLTNADIIPIMNERRFAGMWVITTQSFRVEIALFKGKTSCIDYMLFQGNCSDYTNGNAEKALCILESTKTSDSESRNTSVYQRITKFTTFYKMYPESTAIPIMFWLDSNWRTDKLTPTAIFGLKLLTTMQIRLYMNVSNTTIDIGQDCSIEPFQSTTDLIQLKNGMKTISHNVSVKVTQQDTSYSISIKLDKGKGQSSGKVSHDPNVGLLCGIINCILVLEPNANFIITNHNISQSYFDKSPSSKLWFSIHNAPITFENIQIRNLPCLPSVYFIREHKMTEKLATILCQMISNTQTIFSNHGGCALTSIKGPNGIFKTVGRKMHRPDIVFADDNEIIIVEGKVEDDIKNGCKQLQDEHIGDFISVIKQMYPNHTIKKGLCITISSIQNITKYNSLDYPVLFAIDTEGYYVDFR